MPAHPATFDGVYSGPPAAHAPAPAPPAAPPPLRPPPGPDRGPYGGSLAAVLCLPRERDDASDRLARDRDLAADLARRGARWEPLRNVEVASPGWAFLRALDRAGGPPCVVWLAGTGRVVGVTPAPTPARVRADLASIRATGAPAPRP